MSGNGSFHCQTIAIIGLGLIGSSVARAAHDYKLADIIIAYDRNPLPLQYAIEQGFISEGAGLAEEAVKNADVVIVAVPPSAAGESIARLLGHCKPGALVMDTASTKQEVVQTVQPALRDDVNFIPCHPIAGSEDSGVTAGRADLFLGRRIVLTPEDVHNPALTLASDFWQKIGGVIEYMPAALHDRIYAYVSHLPQLLAFAYRDTGYAELAEKTELFRRFTRLCVSDERLWQDIFETNAEFLGEALSRFVAILSQIRQELAEPNTKTDLKEHDQQAINTVLLPWIVASSYVATVLSVENETGVPFHSFAGQGFQDFAYPASIEPTNYMENISNVAPHVVQAIDVLLDKLSNWIVIKN